MMALMFGVIPQTVPLFFTAAVFCCFYVFIVSLNSCFFNCVSSKVVRFVPQNHFVRRSFMKSDSCPRVMNNANEKNVFV